MPAADILVVLCHSLASPKSVIFKVFLPMSSFSIFSSNKTEKRRDGKSYMLERKQEVNSIKKKK